MNPKQIEKILQEKFSYSGENLKVALQEIEKTSDEIKKAIETFLQTEKITEISREGYTVEKLMKEHGMNPIAAYLTLDFLEKEPEKAKESLKKGHDWIKQ